MQSTEAKPAGQGRPGSRSGAGKLRAGRHGLSRAEVEASQRQRILDGMIECVGECGYSETTVAAVIANARVSRSAFYALFDDKADCFRAAYRELTETLVRELAAVGVAEPDFVAGVRLSVATYLRWCRDWPAGARAWHLGIVALEPDGLALRDEAVARIERLFAAGARRARRELSGLAPVHGFLLEGATQATLALVCRYASDDRLDDLDELAGPVLYLWLVALADQSVAETALAASG